MWSDSTVWQNRMFRGYLARRLYPRYTRETQLSPFVLTLGIPIMCKSHASFSRDGYSRDTCEKTFGLTLGIPVMCRAYVPFRGMLSHEIPAKTLLASNAWVFTLSLTITEPLQQIPITNTVWINYNQIWHGIKANTIHICKLQLYKFLISFSLWDLHLVRSYSKNIKIKWEEI